MTASSLADACDNHFPGDLPAVFPYLVIGTSRGGLKALYECPVGGSGWVTGWDAGAAGWPAERTERAA